MKIGLRVLPSVCDDQQEHCTSSPQSSFIQVDPLRRQVTLLESPSTGGPPTFTDVSVGAPRKPVPKIFPFDSVYAV